MLNRYGLVGVDLFENDAQIQALIHQVSQSPGDRGLHNRLVAALQRAGRNREANDLVVGPFIQAYRSMVLARALHRQRKKKQDADSYEQNLRNAESDMWHAAFDAHESAPSGNPGHHLTRDYFDSDHEHVKALGHLHLADSMTADADAIRGRVEFEKGFRPESAEERANQFHDSYRRHYPGHNSEHDGQPGWTTRKVYFHNWDASGRPGEEHYHEFPEKP